jgi:hypothetical protein
VHDSRWLKSRILAFMADPAVDDFGLLALDLFRYQWERNEAYRRLLEGTGMNPEDIRRWEDIPPVSTAVFKRLVLTCGEPTVVFRTSGTTRGAGRRGEHHLVDTELYRASLRRSFARWVLLAPGEEAGRRRFLVLAPTRETVPDSSLGFMMTEVMAGFGAPGSAAVLGSGSLDVSAAIRVLDAAVADGVPLILLGTNLAFHHLLDRLEDRSMAWRLPDGSRVMDTGGGKGVMREVPREELLGRYAQVFGIPANRVVNEYGMTELGSQFYDASLTGGDPEVKLGPHWVRTRIIDPATGRDVPEGGTGLLLHVDLANMDSVAAIETEDLGYRKGDGFVLAGRSAGAEPRGCSIAADAWLSGGRA